MVYIIHREGDKYAKRSRHRLSPDDQPSSFFHQRERDEGFRSFFTTPVGFGYHPSRKYAVWRAVIKPINVRLLNSEPDQLLPDHDDDELRSFLGACSMLAKAYFGGPNVNVRPLATVDCVKRQGHTRWDLQGARDEHGNRIRQFNVEALQDLAGDSGQNENIVALIAPHMYQASCRDFAWMFSTPLETEHSTSRFWALSTFNILSHVDGLKQQQCAVARHVLYTLLMMIEGLAVCENLRCVLNNCDGTDEASETSLLICPTCIRKLQLRGVIADVPAFLQRLARTLSQEPFRDFCERDVMVLLEILNCSSLDSLRSDDS